MNTSRQTVFDFFSAETEAECKRRIYKSTSCGAWLEFTESGIRIGSIVEGCDFGTVIYPLFYADEFTAADIQARIDAVEAEASALWEWANVTRDKNGRKHMNGQPDAERGCDAPDIDRNYGFLTDGRSG